MDAMPQEDCTDAIAPVELVSKAIPAICRYFEAIYTLLGQ